jgi:alanine racemase
VTRPLRARIDLGSLAHNLSVARSAASRSRIMAVIKANAYGHGAACVGPVLSDADALAVASIDEAVELREAGFRKPIVLLEGIFEPAELKAVLTHELQIVVHNYDQVEWLEAATIDAPVGIWIKINSGMNRLGFEPDQAMTVWRRLQQLPFPTSAELRWMSHLCCADEYENPATTRQLNCFNTALGVAAGERSLANSAAVLSRPDTHLDWVRPGIMLYGASPMAPDYRLNLELKPVMTLESKLIAVHARRSGEAIGYGQEWVCPEDMRVGIVAGGYGDGYPRHAPSGTPVLVNGKAAPLVGRVSMDMVCVDLRAHSNARSGDRVVFWGEGLPVETVAAYAETISYELLCAVSPRVPRIYQQT